MRLVFAGTGSAFITRPDNFNSNMVLENKDKERLLIDCGSDARRSLAALGLTYKDIDHVYISHLHADHVGGLEWLGLRRKFSKHCSRPILFIEPDLINALWENVLAGGMSCLEDEKAGLETFFEPKPIQNHQFFWSDILFQTVKTVHVYSQKHLCPSFGLFFKIHEKNIFITTDTRFQPDIYEEFYTKAEIIFQDAELSAKRSGVHAHYTELKQLDPRIKAKIWLYHYNSARLPNAKEDGFAGFVHRGQVFEF